MANIDGVGPDAETITLEGGGQRSKTPYAFDQLPPRAMFAIARRFQYGLDRGYPAGNWLKLPVNNFIGHGLQHVFAFLMGDTQEGDPGTHLEAAAWNFVAAVEVYLIGKENKSVNPSTHMIKLESGRRCDAMVALYNAINRNKAQGRDAENEPIEYALGILEEMERNSTKGK